LPISVSVTFLIFLASLAAMEYAMRRRPREAEREFLKDGADRQNEAEPSAGGLFQLGKALEEHGRGRLPEPIEEPTNRQPRP